jgi:putative phosphoribosyl transferase
VTGIPTAADTVNIPVDAGVLQGSLLIPPGATGLVLFAHGSGSSRHNPRNTFLADALHAQGIVTLLFDLLTPAEDVRYRSKFDIGLLEDRLQVAVAWIGRQEALAPLALGCFGVGTGSAAAIRLGAKSSAVFRTMVSRGGRPDLAGAEALSRLRAPTLLIVGGRDASGLALNREAFAAMRCEKKLHVVPGAGAQFEEPGTLDQVALLAAEWFAARLRGDSKPV